MHDMKKMFLACLCLFVLASCGAPKVDNQIPEELKFKFDGDLFEVYYPEGWETLSSVGGGVNIFKKDKSITIPFSVFPYEGSRENDISSISELSQAFEKTIGKSGQGTMETREVSGKKALWMEGEVGVGKMQAFMVPLDNAVVSCMMFPGKGASAEDTRLAKLIVNSFRFK